MAQGGSVVVTVTSPLNFGSSGHDRQRYGAGQGFEYGQFADPQAGAELDMRYRVIAFSLYSSGEASRVAIRSPPPATAGDHVFTGTLAD